MISVRFDSSGDYRVRWSAKQQVIIANGVAYVAKESSVPVGQQIPIPTLAAVQAALAAAQAEHSAALSGEAIRATAAEEYRQAMLTAKNKLQTALMRLKNKYINNLAQLEAWGVETVAGSNGIRVRQPRLESEWVNFLKAYVAKESSLTAPEQITDPTLAEMTDLNDTVQEVLATRKAGKDQRETAVQVRSENTELLNRLLQTAAIVLVGARYNGRVTNDLQQWGYDVVEDVAPTKNGNGNEETGS